MLKIFTTNCKDNTIRCNCNHCFLFIHNISFSFLFYVAQNFSFINQNLCNFFPHFIYLTQNIRFVPLIISLQTCLIVFTNNFTCCLTILQLHCISYIQYKKSLISSFIKISFLLSFLFHGLPIPLQIFQIQFILFSDNLQLHLLLHIQC